MCMGKKGRCGQMTIDSAYQYGSYYQNYRSEIKQVSVDEVKQQDKQQLQAAQEDCSRNTDSRRTQGAAARIWKIFR